MVVAERVWVVVVRNDAWPYPDIFGPFADRDTAVTFEAGVLDHSAIADGDSQVQELLPPSEYDGLAAW